MRKPLSTPNIKPSPGQILLKNLDRAELEDLMIRWGEKPFHGRQIFAALYQRGVSTIDEMTDLPLRLRDKLRDFEPLDLLFCCRMQTTPDGTAKALLRLRDGLKVESVWMPEDGYAAQCLSTQVGCPLECTFCATGQMGFQRNLTSGEIVDQVIYFRRLKETTPRNLVFMGMGEPLLNYENLVKAIRILSAADGLAISQRRMAVSTAGIVPGIRRLAEEGLKVKLALSLNAPTDELRDHLMPINRKYPLNELFAAARYYQQKVGHPITFEYTLMPGVNDTETMIQTLRRLLLKIPCKLNLIPLNPIEKSVRRGRLTPLQCTTPLPPSSVIARREAPKQSSVTFTADWDAIFDRFYRVFARDPITLTLRRSRGAEIRAACGQLAIIREP